METEVFYWDEINRKLIWRKLWKRKTVLIAVAVVLFFLTMTYQKVTYTPQYESRATAAVVSDASNINYGGLSNAVKYAATYVDGFKGSRMLSMAKQITGISTAGISLTAAQIGNTNLLELSAVAGDQQTAYEIMNAIVENYSTVIDEMHLSGKAYIVQEASYPELTAAKSSGIVLALVLAFAGAFAAAAGIVLMAALGSTVKTEACAIRRIGDSCLGVIPEAAEAVVISDNEKADMPFSDCVYAAANCVEDKLRAAGKKILLVTSTLDGEGKTVFADNLVRVLAGKGRKATLINCGNLSDELKSSIASAAEQMDYVILDTASMTASIDTEVLAYMADMSLLVVEQDKAKVSAIREAVWKLEESSSEFAGYVLNRFQ